MSDNNNNNAGEESNSSSRKRKADGTDPSPRGKKLGNDLLAALENPDLCDVTLVGSDGGRVPAIRIYLSARSEMLQQMLVGRFKEASEEEVRMDYPAAVLKAIVHFCCTDKAPDVCALDADIVESIRLAVQLVAAADYYGLVSLNKKASHAITGLLNSKRDDHQMWSRCVCSAFEEASQKLSLGEFSRRLYKGILHGPKLALITGDRPGVTLLSSENLRTIVEGSALRARAWVLFQAIQMWLENSEPVDEETFESDEDRRIFAKQLASNIELRMIQPKSLLGPVSDSGLVAQDKIIQALQNQSGGGFVGIYGCRVDGSSATGDGNNVEAEGNEHLSRVVAPLVEVNGMYEEVPMSAIGVEAASYAIGQRIRKFFPRIGHCEGIITMLPIIGHPYYRVRFHRVDVHLDNQEDIHQDEISNYVVGAVVPEALNPSRVVDMRRFDKKCERNTDEIKVALLSWTEGRIQQFWLVAPPPGAGNLVLTGDSNKIREDNRLLYTGHRFTRSAKADGSDVKWGVGGLNTIGGQTKQFPRLIIGQTLTTTSCLPPARTTSVSDFV